VTVSTTFEETLGALRVTLAYIKLLSIPEEYPGSRTILVFQTETYEIRIFRLPKEDSNCEPAIWMGLFDRGTQFPVDSGRCRAVENALAVFEEFVAQIKSL
jgi:hypothetical protein